MSASPNPNAGSVPGGTLPDPTGQGEDTQGGLHAREPGRFVWPPRTPPGDQPAGVSHATVPAAVGGGQPPRISKVRSPNSADRANSRATLARVRDALLDVEETWLGVTRRSFSARAAEAGWAPDAPSSYCARCGVSVGPHEADPAGAPGGPSCPACRESRLAWDCFVRLGEYDGVVRDAVHDLKFTRWRRAGRELGRELGRTLLNRLAAAGIPADRAVLVPVPTSLVRRLVRGIDHTLVLARAVRSVTGIPIVRALRRSHRPSQLDVPRSARRANVARSIRCRSSRGLAGKTIVVLDDVVTTGATMSAACRALAAGIRRSYGARPARGVRPAAIWVACVGRTPEPGEGRSSTVRARGSGEAPA